MAITEHGDSQLCCGHVLVVHLRRIISRRRRTYLKLSLVALPTHTPLPDSGGTGSLWVLVGPLFRKAPRLAPTSVAHEISTIQETKCSKHYACRFRMHAAIVPGPFGDIRFSAARVLS